MKYLTITTSAPLPQLAQIEFFEAENNLNLPDSYKAFLLKNNPITVRENFFLYNNAPYTLNDFYPFGFMESLTLQKAYHNMKEIYEDKYIAFADDPGGWEYVIAIKKENYGTIYLCRMDEELDDGLVELADSFADFINGLQLDTNQ